MLLRISWKWFYWHHFFLILKDNTFGRFVFSIASWGNILIFVRWKKREANLVQLWKLFWQIIYIRCCQENTKGICIFFIYLKSNISNCFWKDRPLTLEIKKLTFIAVKHRKLAQRAGLTAYGISLLHTLWSSHFLSFCVRLLFALLYSMNLLTKMIKLWICVSAPSKQWNMFECCDLHLCTLNEKKITLFLCYIY